MPQLMPYRYGNLFGLHNGRLVSDTRKLVTTIKKIAESIGCLQGDVISTTTYQL
jgi:hypothetical protein